MTAGNAAKCEIAGGHRPPLQLDQTTFCAAMTRSSQRLDLYVAELHDAGAVLQPDRASAVSHVLGIHGFGSVQDDNHVWPLRGDLEGIPLAAGFRRNQRFG